MTAFGASGIEVSRLGFGAGGLGDERLSDLEAERLVLGAIDEGVTFIDAARSYGSAEERIGRALVSRRDDVVLSTKGGYGLPGVEDWTAAAVRAGIDDALRRLRTDRVDIFHLHSCPLEVLERGDLQAALDEAKDAGKIRVAAYSGENEALAWAVASGRFGGVQCSVNLFDQRSLDGCLTGAARAGVGVVGKRPLGNCPWRFDTQPHGDYAETYWLRMREMKLDPSPLEWAELALRFAAFAPGVCSVIAGTTRLEHLRENARLLERGPLDPATIHAVRRAFRSHDAGWTGQV